LTFDVVEYENLYLKLKPHGIGGIQHRHNFDGIVIFGGIPDNGYRAYVQFFRTGVIEFVWVYEIRDENRFIKSYDYEFKTLQNFISAIEVFRELDIHPPVFVFLTLSGLTGYSLYINDKLRWNYDLDDNYTFDRDILAIHDIQLDSFDENNNNIFRPLFDIVWNAAGLRESLNFNENNEFIRRP
jgi:hypothetical protein